MCRERASKRFTTSIVGEHNVTNLLLCIAVAYHEGIPLRDIAMRIRSLQPAESRLVTEDDRSRASPSSTTPTAPIPRASSAP